MECAVDWLFICWPLALFGIGLSGPRVYFELKNIPIIDILIIGAGFVLRLFAGGYAINEMVTIWIISLTFTLSLFIALAKRKADMHLSFEGKEVRRNIDYYDINIINKSLHLAVQPRLQGHMAEIRKENKHLYAQVVELQKRCKLLEDEVCGE